MTLISRWTMRVDPEPWHCQRLAEKPVLPARSAWSAVQSWDCNDYSHNISLEKPIFRKARQGKMTRISLSRNAIIQDMFPSHSFFGLGGYIQVVETRVAAGVTKDFKQKGAASIRQFGHMFFSFLPIFWPFYFMRKPSHVSKTMS